MGGEDLWIDVYGELLAALVLLVHVLAGGGLMIAARRVARVRGGRWRLWMWPPLVALAMPVCGWVATIAMLITAFGTIAHADAASRATVLARGIAEAMNAIVVSVAIAWAIYAITAIALGIARRGAPAAPAPADRAR